MTLNLSATREAPIVLGLATKDLVAGPTPALSVRDAQDIVDWAFRKGVEASVKGLSLEPPSYKELLK